ncbi:hypothetical protein BHE74_00035205 [Ensete ventricosum]|uniref:Sulfotransferase n=1 Tax=Ensete ventricosum TaxID=4639 RepID=A0A427A9A4_ENSVE|nr:hypothetical protein B296_00034116 [Ensete ventricosum]RWW57967.1 hypothetical protein BHE74_00035205 [Ensete ventricosum]
MDNACNLIEVIFFSVGVQDSLVIKPQKKYPLGLWIAVLGLIMISGIYICSLCIKQRVLLVTPNQMKVTSTRQTCHDPSVPKPELHYMHYPEPTSYSRYGGVMQHHEEIIEYFKKRGVSAILLFRRNLLRRLVSVLANTHDRDAKQLNGTHKAHVHSTDEADVLARYKPTINTTLLIPELKHTDKWASEALGHFKSSRHILLYYEDLVNNKTKLMDVLEFLKLPQQKLFSRHVKIHNKPLSDQIENWDAVHAALKGTEYESFVNTDYGV